MEKNRQLFSHFTRHTVMQKKDRRKFNLMTKNDARLSASAFSADAQNIPLTEDL